MTIRVGDQGEYVLGKHRLLHQSDVRSRVTPTRTRGKPQSYALAVTPLRRIFDTCDRGRQHCRAIVSLAGSVAGLLSPAAQTSMTAVTR